MCFLTFPLSLLSRLNTAASNRSGMWTTQATMRQHKYSAVDVVRSVPDQKQSTSFPEEISPW